MMNYEHSQGGKDLASLERVSSYDSCVQVRSSYNFLDRVAK